VTEYERSIRLSCACAGTHLCLESLLTALHFLFVIRLLVFTSENILFLAGRMQFQIFPRMIGSFVTMDLWIFISPPLPRLHSSWADSWVLRPFNLKTFAFGMCYKIEMVSQESTCILEHVSPPCVNCFTLNNLAPINRAKITKACCQLSNSQDRHRSKKVFLSNWKTEVPYLIPEQDPSTNK
jgi:hypothetical protein